MIGSIVHLETGQKATVVKIRYAAQYQAGANWHDGGEWGKPDFPRLQADVYHHEGLSARVVMRVTAEIVLPLEDSDNE